MATFLRHGRTLISRLPNAAVNSTLSTLVLNKTAVRIRTVEGLQAIFKIEERGTGPGSVQLTESQAMLVL